MTANQAEFPVRTLRRVLKVSPSAYYAWRDRPPSRRVIDDGVLTERICAIHVASVENDGSPNIHAELRDEGTRVGRKRIARLIRKAGLRGVSRRRGLVVTTQCDRKQRRAPDLVNRKFVAAFPQQQTMLGFYAAALDAYFQRRWDEAMPIFGERLALCSDDVPSRIMDDRCRSYRATPPPEDWDGAFEHLTKY